jgi:hypothetical protein
MWRRVDDFGTDISEERISSIFKVENSFLADFSTLKMEAIRSSETSVHTTSTHDTSQETEFFIVTAVKT